MRKPKVKNKYNLTMKKINNLKIGDESKICEPLFWRNNVVSAWCISKDIGTDADKRYGTDNSFWIGIYDEPYYGKRFHVKCYSFGGMCGYNFKKFYDEKEIENEIDLQTQEELLKTVNHLIDEGILVMEDEGRSKTSN